MREIGWTASWDAPVTIALSRDHTDPEAFGLRQGSNGIVQVTLGQEARVTLTTPRGPIEVVGGHTTQDLVDGVTSLRAGAGAGTHTGPGTAAAAAAAAAPTNLAAEQTPDFDETVLTSSTATTSTAAPSTAVPNPTPDFDETILTRSTPAPTVTQSVGAPDFDDTILSVRPPAPASPASRAQSPAPLIEVTDRNGSVLHRVDGTLYIGRSPRVPDLRGAREGALVFVSSTTDHVSSTHLQIVDDDGMLLVRDLRSTNGTVLIPPVGEPYRLEPNELLPVPVGSRLALCDDVFVDVVGERRAV